MDGLVPAAFAVESAFSFLGTPTWPGTQWHVTVVPALFRVESTASDTLKAWAVSAAAVGVDGKYLPFRPD
ncbi:hypothetical protein O3P69_017277 [Scylla paramamosain]|uniref:Uncharacterized protein n=1 Tax=Scylla paramamosain TaxID=85552 RepID=A0AAW0TYE2_SCYPA